MVCSMISKTKSSKNLKIKFWNSYMKIQIGSNPAYYKTSSYFLLSTGEENNPWMTTWSTHTCFYVSLFHMWKHDRGRQNWGKKPTWLSQSKSSISHMGRKKKLRGKKKKRRRRKKSQTSVPAMPIASPMSASCKAGASLVPSPVTATTSLNIFLKWVTKVCLSDGEDRAITCIHYKQLKYASIFQHR